MASLSDWYNANPSDRGANQTVTKPSSGGSSSGGFMNPGTATGGGSPGSGGFMPIPTAGGGATYDPAKAIADALAKQKAQFDAQQAAAEAARKAAEQAAAQKKTDYINTQTPLYDQYFSNQQNSQLASLRNAREQSLSGFNNSEKVAQQNAYNNRNQVDAQSTQASQRLKELMAANGLLSSGDNVTQNLQLENQRQSSLNEINQSTGNVLQNVADQRNLINNQAASTEQSLTDKISADKTQSLIDLQKYGDQKETDLNKFNYQQYTDSIKNAMAERQLQLQDDVANAQYAGNFRGQDTVSALNANRDYALKQAMFNADQQNRGSDDSFRMAQLSLQAQAADRAKKNDNVSLAQWLTQTYATPVQPKDDAQVAFDQVAGKTPLSGQQFQWGQQMDKSKLEQTAQQFAQQMGLDWAKLNQQQQNMMMDNAAQLAGIGLQRDKFNYDKDPNNPANQLSNENKQSLIDGRSATKYRYVVDELDSSPYVQKQFDALGKPTGSIKATNPAGLEAYILNQGLSDSDARKLYARYGLKWGG